MTSDENQHLSLGVQLKQLPNPKIGVHAAFQVVTKDDMGKNVEDVLSTVTPETFSAAIKHLWDNLGKNATISSKHIYPIIAGVPDEKGFSLLMRIGLLKKDAETQSKWWDFWADDVQNRVPAIFLETPTREGYFGTVVFIVGLSLRAAYKDQENVKRRMEGLTELLDNK